MDTHLAGIRVLHLVASTDRRGAERAALDLSDYLSHLGLPGEVVALAAGTQGGLDLPTMGPSRYALRTLGEVRRRAADASILVAHGSSTLPAAALATLGLRTPFVYRSIGDPAAWLTTPARRIRTGWAVRRATGVVALWRGAAVTWHSRLRVRPERIGVIPNGVRAETFKPPSGEARSATRAALGLSPEGPIVLYLGALSREKRVDLAIRAVAQIPGATLAVVGDGPQRVSLSAAADDRTRILGPTSEPWKALTAADVVVLPSDTEGQPAVAIEAGLTGVPVVATRVGGLPEIVLDGQTGVLVPPGDAGAVAEGLRRCLDHRDRYGESARVHCLQNFTLERTGEKWVRFLQSVIKTAAIPEQHSA